MQHSANKYIRPNCKIFKFPSCYALSRHIRYCKSSKKRGISQTSSSAISNGKIRKLSTNDDVKSNFTSSNSNGDSTISRENDSLVYENDNNYGIIGNNDNFDIINGDEENTNGSLTTPEINITTKYYNWQMRLGHVLYFGCHDTSNNNVDVSSISTNTMSFSSSNQSYGLQSIMKLGRVKDINGLFYGIPDANDVMDIFTFAKMNMLSETSGDQLLQLLKEIIKRHSESIGKYFIYDRIENLNVAVTRAVSQFYQGIQVNITLPTKLLGTNELEMNNIKRILDFRNLNPSEYIIAKGNGLNIVELIGEYLVNIDIKDFDFIPTTLYDENDNSISYGRFSTGDLFAHIYEEVISQYGNGVTPICIQLSFDATDITGGGGSNPRSSTPFHIRSILNVSDEVFGL